MADTGANALEASGSDVGEEEEALEERRASGGQAEESGKRRYRGSSPLSCSSSEARE